MGEHKRRPMGALAKLKEGGDQPQVVDTLGGRMHVRWDEGAAATPHGQLVFFAEFLATTGVFERWVSSCPLEYRSGNAPDKRDVLGTLDAGPAGRTPALCPHHRAARRRGGRAGAGHEQSGQRRRAAPSAWSASTKQPARRGCARR
jgi:hypothetical protein